MRIIALAGCATLLMIGLAAPAAAQPGNTWGGYVATGTTFTSVSVDWIEPSATCDSSSDALNVWAGLDGYGDDTVEQTGIETDCSGGSPEYYGWFDLYPQAPVVYQDQVSPGDQINAAVATDGSGNYTLTLRDLTLGWTETTHRSGNGQNASAEVVVESPDLSYPDFGTVTFTNFMINGQDASNFNPQPLNPGGGVNPGTLTGTLADGGFSVTYQHE